MQPKVHAARASRRPNISRLNSVNFTNPPKIRAYLSLNGLSGRKPPACMYYKWDSALNIPTGYNEVIFGDFRVHYNPNVTNPVSATAGLLAQLERGSTCPHADNLWAFYQKGLIRNKQGISPYSVFRQASSKTGMSQLANTQHEEQGKAKQWLSDHSSSAKNPREKKGRCRFRRGKTTPFENS